MRLRNIRGSKDVIASCPFVVQEPESCRGRWAEIFGNEMGIDLDVQYKEDEGKGLMQKLKYSRKESREGMPPQCGIVFDIDVDVYTGMHSLRASVKKYFEFLQQEEKD